MIRKLYDNLEEILGSSLLVALCLVTIFKIVSRYVTRTSASWAEEVATILFMYLVFVGASLALKKRDHFAIDFIVDKMPAALGRLLRLLSAVLVIVFAGLVLYYGGRLVASGWNARTAALEMPQAVANLAIPLGGLLMLVRAVEDLVKRLREPAAPEHVSAKVE